MVLESLGKTGTSVPIIMREKEALIDPNTQITEAIGSGPFKFAKEQWVPGSKTVYLKNADYVPRPGNEPPSGFAGSKIPKVDRIELVVDLRPADRDVGAGQRRDRFLRAAEHRLHPDPAQGPRRQADEDRQDRLASSA